MARIPNSTYYATIGEWEVARQPNNAVKTCQDTVLLDSKEGHAFGMCYTVIL
jgi:hypothetical protein